MTPNFGAKVAILCVYLCTFAAKTGIGMDNSEQSLDFSTHSSTDTLPPPSGEEAAARAKAQEETEESPGASPKRRRLFSGKAPRLFPRRQPHGGRPAGDEGGDTPGEGTGPPPRLMTLRTENLVKKYGKRTVVSHVSINVRQGEIVGLLGPNGAGKTTSFYMTTGLVTANEGRIFLDDLDITSYPVYKRARFGIGYLAQEASVFRKMTVEDNIASVLEMTGKPKSYQKEKLESLLEEFTLNKVRKNLGDQLSGGERRRTEIARCLAIDPKFIMLDEPFAGVDPIAVEDIQQIVWNLKKRNIGILITDHNAPETLTITDRAYLLFEGRILFQGSPEELANNQTVKEKYLGRSFVLRKKDFQK